MESASGRKINAPEQRLLAAIEPAFLYWREHADMRGSILAVRSLLSDLFPNDKFLSARLFEAYKCLSDYLGEASSGLPNNTDGLLRNLGFSEAEIRAASLFWGAVAGIFKLSDVQDFFADLAQDLKKAEEVFLYGFSVASFTAAKNERFNLNAGDIFPFGMDSDGDELVWRVLSTDFTTALICSEQSVGRGPYHYDKSPCTWYDCFLRRWLNTEFLQACFTEEERRRIAVVSVSNHANSKYNVSGGSATRDKVFLLSEDEAELYFETDASRILYENNEDGSVKPARYWLRTPGQSGNCVAFVNSTGALSLYGFVNTGILSVRPAMRIRL